PGPSQKSGRRCGSVSARILGRSRGGRGKHAAAKFARVRPERRCYRAGRVLMNALRTERHWPTSDGWMLDVRRHFMPEFLDTSLRPLLLIPGYCMNTTPLGFHPSGPSMIEFLAGRGFEVWTANLRGQGDSRSLGGSRDAGFRELAL